MGTKTASYVIVAAASASLSGWVTDKLTEPTPEELLAKAAAIQAEWAVLDSRPEVTAPEIVAALPVCRSGKPVACQPEVNDLGTRYSYYRCDCTEAGAIVQTTYCDDKQESDARAALKDDRPKPALVVLPPQPAAAVDPHPRDGRPVYGTFDDPEVKPR